jgi:phosphatidylinositol-3,4,5-trisphosphate 3-phosphatase/dual-specificity protein phosphatase PTEN
VICCYLLHTEHQTSASRALKFYGSARTANGKGVTIPSQQRYIQYYSGFLNGGFHKDPSTFNFSGYKMKITGFHLSHLVNYDPGGGCDPFFIVQTMSGEKIYDSMKADKKTVEWRKEEPREFKCSIEVQGDVHVVFYDWDRFGANDKMFGFWLNTSFIPDTEVKLRVRDLDGAVKDKKFEHFHKDCVCSVRFDKVDPAATATHKRMVAGSRPKSAKSSSSSSSSSASKGKAADSDDDEHDEDGDDGYEPPRKTSSVFGSEPPSPPPEEEDDDE